MLDKDKLPAMYRRLFEVMRGNNIYETKELDDPLAVEKLTRAFRITRDDVSKIKKELESKK